MPAKFERIGSTYVSLKMKARALMGSPKGKGNGYKVIKQIEEKMILNNRGEQIMSIKLCPEFIFTVKSSLYWKYLIKVI